MNLPTIVVPGGSMLNGKFRGKDVGSGTLTWQLLEGLKAGTVSKEEMIEAEDCMSRSAGQCMTMGTASTMACMVEALGLTLPGDCTYQKIFPPGLLPGFSAKGFTRPT